MKHILETIGAILVLAVSSANVLAQSSTTAKPDRDAIILADLKSRSSYMYLQTKLLSKIHTRLQDKLDTLEKKYPTLAGPGGKLELDFDRLRIGDVVAIDGLATYATQLTSVVDRSVAGAKLDVKATSEMLRAAAIHIALTSNYLTNLEKAISKLSLKCYQTATPPGDRYSVVGPKKNEDTKNSTTGKDAKTK